VLAFRNFHQQTGGTRKAALRAFVAQFNQCRIEGISAEARARNLTLTNPTLLRWLRKFERGGPEALTRKESKRRGASIIAMTPGMADYIVAAISKKPHIRATRVYEGLCTRSDRVPSRRAVQNRIKRWKRENPALMMRLRDPDDFKRRFTIALGDAAANITRVNQLWESDGTRLEVQCVDGLFHLESVIEVRSRRICSILTPTASAQTTASILRKAIPAMGVPERIKGDWGKEYINKRTRRAMLRLGITWQKVERPYSGELKPFIERGIGTQLHMFSSSAPVISVIQARRFARAIHFRNAEASAAISRSFMMCSSLPRSCKSCSIAGYPPSTATASMRDSTVRLPPRSSPRARRAAKSAASSMSDCSICFSAKMASRLSGPRGFASKARSSGMTR
jgi:transposase InsO family protein